MHVKLYNTLSRKTEPLKTIKKNKISLYTCGPTVYNYAHIGNLRTYIFEDILKRVLLYNNYKVKHVMNITDVGHLTSDADEGEDKMEKGSTREKLSAKQIAKKYTKEFKNDLQKLNIIEPSKWCVATENIKIQIKLVKKLVKKGFTYTTSDGIYFDTSKINDYGKLARLDIENLEAGKRVDMGEKKNITDFALWKFSPKNSARQMEWKTPWGVGFPGWHLECSAMSAKFLGQPFDIHCGGIDHLAVHHTNEIAQSEAAFDKPLANYWLHGEYLLVNNGKMSKSGNNFITIQTLEEKKFSPIAYRYFLLQTHYRKQLNFSFESLRAAQNGLSHLYNSARELPQKGLDNKKIKEKFLQLINNDLYIAGALALVWDTIKQRTISQETLIQFDKILGLKIKESLKKKDTATAKTQEIVTQRDEARKKKDWKKSDQLRDKLIEMGYEVKDSSKGTEIRKNL